MTSAEHTKSQFNPRKSSKWKKILIIFTTVILTLGTTAIIIYSRYLHPTGEILPEIYAIRVDNPYRNTAMGNMFLLPIGDKYIAIDAGADKNQTERELQKIGISADDVVAIFITHSDWDHTGSLPIFTQATMYTGDTQFQYVDTTRFTAVSEIPDLPHIIMTDGDVIELSNRTIRCIYTPGHTSDSVSFLIDDKYLFVGDLFISLGMARDDGELQKLSREKVLRIEETEYIFNGHFGLFKNVKFFRWLF